MNLFKRALFIGVASLLFISNAEALVTNLVGNEKVEVQGVAANGQYSGQTEGTNTKSIAALSNTSGTYGTPFSTSITGNPLVLDNSTVTEVSTSLSSAALTTIIASTAGRQIYPIAVTIMASGTAATATSLALECSDGTLIANWPIALLTNNNPQGAFSSTAVTRGVALGSGCPASTAVALSNVGTNITTTTQVDTNVLYTLQ